MKRITTLEFRQGEFKFSSGHFTIFSATSRERLHGHNYTLEASIKAPLDEPGITFDYRIFRNKLLELCKELDTCFLLPTNSPYLKIEEVDDYYHAEFNGKQIPFLKGDVLLLPLTNITLEELSQWFVKQITQDQKFITQHGIVSLEIKVFNSPGQCAVASWRG